MIKIMIDGEALDLPQNFSADIEDTSPVFNDRGSQSLPATVPATSRNCRLLGFSHRLDASANPNNPQLRVTVSDGSYVRTGLLNVTSASSTDGITLNIGFDNSTAYAKWTQTALSKLESLPARLPAGYSAPSVAGMLHELDRIYAAGIPATDDLAVFPLAVACPDTSGLTSYEILNLPANGKIARMSKVMRIIDGAETDVKVPDGYGVTPFVRVWRVLELIFADLGAKMISNPFKTDADLARLVVLNNVADAVCRGELRYADLLPDCTVEAFLNALWVRFGLVYHVDEWRGVVELKLLRDILREKADFDLDRKITERPLITYNTAQYVKLSASTSIEGAEPSTERFEDFSKGASMDKVRVGARVGEWRYRDDGQGWDGDIRDDIYEPEDPDYPDPDYPDYELESVKSRVSAVTDAEGDFLARECVTGTWFRLDSLNGKTKESSTGFFNWDPATAGMEAFELASDDEWVPVVKARYADDDFGAFYDYCPAYLFGARHLHSYIQGASTDEADGSSTPLAFMFAYPCNNGCAGRFSPEDETGRPLDLSYGGVPELSLLFQFKDGLFANFWADYDELLRHGNRSVEVDVRLSKAELMGLRMLSPVKLGGVRCLIDKIAYALPAAGGIGATLTLRTIAPHGRYDIAAEQGVPDFVHGDTGLVFVLVSDSYDPEALAEAGKLPAVAQFIRETGYETSGTPGDYRLVDTRSLKLVSVRRLQPTWESDPRLPVPTYYGQKNLRDYQAEVTYEVYEVHDMAAGPTEPEDWELEDTPVGTVSVRLEYRVELRAVWKK